AGATGGYFGGRLLQHGRDATFLVREKRAQQLARHGLAIRSATGDVDLGAPRTAILPLLNGMRQLDLLDAAFGAQHVLGGQCVISATLDARGVVQHLNPLHSITFGERDGSASSRMQAISRAFADAGFDSRPSHAVVQDMWDKWVFLATLAGITCLMRGSIGEIVAAGGREAALALLEECRAVAAAAGHAPAERVMQRARAMLTEAGSPLAASMLRDLQQGHPTEAD